MKKTILILLMVFAFTVINAQDYYRFKTTHRITHNISGVEDEVETPFEVTFLIKDGHYITVSGKKIILADEFFETTLSEGDVVWKAYGVDWDDDDLYILLDTENDITTMGIFWDTSYQIFYGEITYIEN